MKNEQPTTKKKYDIYTILYKEQYRLKLGIIPLVLSKISIIAGVVCFYYFDLQNAFFIYGILLITYYKFAFNQTKDGQQLDSFVYVWLAKFNKVLRAKKQHKIDKSAL